MPPATYPLGNRRQGLILALLMLVVFFSITRPWEAPSLPTIESQLRSVFTRMIIRVPAYESIVQEDLLLFVEEETPTTPWLVVRTASSYASHSQLDTPITRMHLPTDLQTNLSVLHTAWCRTPPTIRPLATNELFYDVALRCPHDRIIHVQIPLDQLPPILAALIERIPSPLPHEAPPRSAAPRAHGT